MTAMTRLQILRGTTAQRLSFVPKKGELVMDLDSNFLYIGDGVTAGGVLAAPLAAVSDRIATVVKNVTGSLILKGTPLYIVGNSSGMISVGVGDSSDPQKSDIAFIAESNISNNSTGLALISGVLNGIDTSAYTMGGSVFLAVGGMMTPTAPVEPNFIVHLGDVITADVNGSLLVQIMHPIELPNLPDSHVPIGVSGGNTTTINLFNSIRGTVLTGLSLALGTAITAADTVLSAFGKLQKQVSDNLTTLNNHIANTLNPHAVTKAQVGLGNVPNVDATLRSNHTGSQLASTISDFSSAADARITAQKAQPNGLATLGGDGKLPTSQLPALAITDRFVVGSQAAMLALVAETGDIAIRTDLNKSFILSGDPTVLANWQELLTPTDLVLSINGQTGAVSLTTTNINEGTNLYFTTARVLATLLTGLDTGLTGAITAGDTILQAMGRLQNQINARALSSIQIINGYGITGGGDLTANRTLAVALSTVISESAGAVNSTGALAIITGLELTNLPAGNWLVTVSGDVRTTADALGGAQLYKNGVAVANTLRGVGSQGSFGDITNRSTLHIQAIVNSNGTDDFDVRWLDTVGVLTITDRSIIALRIS